MTPLQINQKIAEMKQLKMIHAPNYSSSATATLIFDAPDIDKYDDWSYKNWAENISDAWELFEEMPLAEIFHTNLKDVKYTVTIWVRNKHTDEFCLGDRKVFGKGITAPLTICAAYITWRESNA